MANAATAETPPLSPGDLIAGKYRIESVEAIGTAGVVFAARHAKLGERVALKFLRPEVAYLPSLRSRFEHEARAAARLRSEHVVRVLDVETTEKGLPCIVMEYLEGCDLKKHLAARGPLPLGEAAEYVAQACIGLAEVHSMGMVHRDLRPSNLFLTRRSDGSSLIKVLDFGISKTVSEVREGTDLTWMDSLLGSAKYISPEQARCAWRVDKRSDVWSLGVILHELVTGELPFSGATIGEVLSAILTEPPRPLPKAGRECTAELEKVISRCLEKDAARRTPSVTQLALALTPWVRPDTRIAVSRLAIGPHPTILRSLNPRPTESLAPPDSGCARGSFATSAVLDDRTGPGNESTPLALEFPGRMRTAKRSLFAVLAACGVIGCILGARGLCRSGWKITMPRPVAAQTSTVALHFPEPIDTGAARNPGTPPPAERPAAIETATLGEQPGVVNATGAPALDERTGGLGASSALPPSDKPATLGARTEARAAAKATRTGASSTGSSSLSLPGLRPAGSAVPARARSSSPSTLVATSSPATPASFRSLFEDRR